MRISKRDFLVGSVAAVSGMGALGAGRWAWSRANPPPPPPPDDGKRASYSQSGEDLIVSFLFDHLLKLKTPTYIDIGAWDATLDNNTYLFYLRGARGVLVEPNPSLVEDLKRVRPGDTVLNAGIGAGPEGEADYYMMNSSGLNTFSKEQAEHVEKTSKGEHRVVRVIKMPLLNINKVIAQHFDGRTPDFISIDVEGLDLAILKSLDFARYRPRVFCVETLVTGTPKYVPEVGEFLAGHGYVVRGQTIPNTIFVEKSLLDS